MARQGIAYCQALGLPKIMITCQDSNEPSWRIIEKLGGKLEGKFFDDFHGETVRRYWIELAAI